MELKQNENAEVMTGILADEDAGINDIPEAEEMSEETAEKIIESILFAAGYPVEYSKLADVIGITEKKVKKIVRESAEKYEDRGVQLLVLEKSCQLCTKEIYGDYIKAALGIKQGGNLSNSSLEVLAIVAYHQPVTKAYIEQVRGVDCSYALISLQNKNLIEKSGKLDVPGHPTLYSTTNDFLRCFGISSLDELPEIDVLK